MLLKLKEPGRKAWLQIPFILPFSKLINRHKTGQHSNVYQ